MARKSSQEEVLNKIREIHGERYDLSKVVYINKRTKFELVCKNHGAFLTSWDQVIRGQGCPVCGKSNAAINRRVSFEDFLSKASEVHNSRYKYDKASYKKIADYVRIKCPDHGWFEQRADAHIRQVQGCPECGFIAQGDKRRMPLSEFIEKANKVHTGKYTYSKASFKSNRDIIEIKCKKHGYFFQSVTNHLTGSGCPDCNNSKGENKVKQILISKKIEFVQQKSFKDLKHHAMLKCDFYLPSYEAIIEFNGRQHYQEVKAFGGKKGFEETKLRDQIKRDFLASKGIKLLEIHYLDKEIDKTISSFLNLT
jgi:Zn finger protein HypA/HybF involved in hydrogenase expression